MHNYILNLSIRLINLSINTYIILYTIVDLDSAMTGVIIEEGEGTVAMMQMIASIPGKGLITLKDKQDVTAEVNPREIEDPGLNPANAGEKEVDQQTGGIMHPRTESRREVVREMGRDTMAIPMNQVDRGVEEETIRTIVV